MSTTTTPSTTAAFPPVIELSPADAREVLRQVQASVPVELPPAQIDDRVIPGGPTGEVSIWIVRPAKITGVCRWCSTPAAAAGSPAIRTPTSGSAASSPTRPRQSSSSTTKPRHPKRTTRPKTSRPTPRCTGPSAAPPRSAPTRPGSSLIGDSVGGNMTAALTLMAKQHGGPQIAAQLLFYLVTDASLGTSTCQRYAEGPWLSREAMRWFWDSCLPDQARQSEVTASPLQASPEQLRGLAPRPDHQRRAGRAPRRERGLRPQLSRGGRAGHPGPLRRHDPHRAAQPDHPHRQRHVGVPGPGEPRPGEPCSRRRLISAAKAQGRERTIAARRKLSTQ